MNWADSAILAAAILAVVNVVDSHLIARRLPSLRAFLFPVGIIALIYGLVVFIAVPFSEDAETKHILYAIASSFIRSLGVGSFLYAMQKAEVSRIIPVVNTHPVLVTIMAVILLDEELIGLEWFAILITVAGAVLISIRRNENGFAINISRYTALPFLAAFCLAGANLTSKYALEGINSWNMYTIGSFIWGSVCVVSSASPNVLSELRNLNRQASTMTILVINETLAPIAIVLLFWSIERGPVSLVSTIAVTQSAFVLVFAMIMGWVSSRALLERKMSWRTFVLRLCAIIMMIAGVAIIYLI